MWNDTNQVFGIEKSQDVSLEIRHLRLVNQFLLAHAYERYEIRVDVCTMEVNRMVMYCYVLLILPHQIVVYLNVIPVFIHFNLSQAGR